MSSIQLRLNFLIKTILSVRQFILERIINLRRLVKRVHNIIVLNQKIRTFEKITNILDKNDNKVKLEDLNDSTKYEILITRGSKHLKYSIKPY